jgi:GT2 family glycosyltransferase
VPSLYERLLVSYQVVGLDTSPPLPRASIIVNTLDRAPHLRRLLTTLQRLDYPAFEVIVVNGPSTDETEAVLAEFAGQVKVVRCKDTNVGRSRNLGIGAAAGDMVAFIDDDAVPASPEWLLGLGRALAARPQVAAVGGPVLEGDGTEYEFQERLISDYGLHVRDAAEATRLRVPANARRWTRSLAGGNCAFRREVLLQIGGFDEAFAYYFDDTDICWRIASAGHEIAMAPESAVRHYKAPSRRRRAPYDQSWDVMARSDAYYGLKNGLDALPIRLLTTLRLARHKPVCREINWYYRVGRYGAWRRVRYLGRWARGFAAGVWIGLIRRRRTPLDPTAASPRPFLPFVRVDCSLGVP